MEPSTTNKYRLKSIDSFQTRFDLFLFKKVLDNTLTETINESEFANFHISQKLIKIYATQYYQWEYQEKILGISINDIYKRIEKWENEHNDVIDSLKNYYIKAIFPTIFSYNEFKDFFENPEQKCYYCGITTEMIKSLIEKQRKYTKRGRGFSLEIDRKKPNEEYTLSNSVLCCYWCNNAKTDEFCDEEFMEVGTAIGNIWRKRLST